MYSLIRFYYSFEKVRSTAQQIIIIIFLIKIYLTRPGVNKS